MHKTIPSLCAALLSLLLMSACSHPVADLAYPDGSVRTPINPQKPAAPQKQAETP
ncbi:hypothetical protein [Rhizobacter sp. Root1221]|uniref:hypothetical protein n=1 Tax=Rhizobacter sp. Root1221 TaxID=1736433 RepID=UPI000AAE33B4|nr:hypothetical protein [Rhizobacter sp. Root1221]